MERRFAHRTQVGIASLARGQVGLYDNLLQIEAVFKRVFPYFPDGIRQNDFLEGLSRKGSCTDNGYVFRHSEHSLFITQRSEGQLNHSAVAVVNERQSFVRIQITAVLGYADFDDIRTLYHGFDADDRRGKLDGSERFHLVEKRCAERRAVFGNAVGQSEGRQCRLIERRVSYRRE